MLQNNFDKKKEILIKKYNDERKQLQENLIKQTGTIAKNIKQIYEEKLKNEAAKLSASQNKTSEGPNNEDDFKVNKFA